MTSSTATVCPVISEPRPRLRAERLRRNLSREDAARRIGITERTLRELELGNHVPHDRTMIRIADYYGVSSSSFRSRRPRALSAGRAGRSPPLNR
jgi:transcriptional regulator with XRE-family HTH domain